VDNLIIARIDVGPDMSVFIYDVNGNGANIVVPKVFYTLQWVHIMIVYNGQTNEVRIYKNGVFQISQISTVALRATARGNCYIGKSNHGEGFFNGLIDHIDIYNMIIPEPAINLLFRTPMYMVNCDGTDGTLNGGVTVSQGVCNFNGVNQYLDLSNAMTFGGSFTVAMWAQFQAFNSWSRLLDCGNGCAIDNLLIANPGTDNRLSIQVYAGTVCDNSFFSDYWLQLNTWYHLAVTFDAINQNATTLYRNAVSVSTKQLTMAPLNVPRKSCFIGKSNWPDQYFQGSISKFQIFRSVLTADDISHIHA